MTSTVQFEVDSPVLIFSFIHFSRVRERVGIYVLSSVGFFFFFLRNKLPSGVKMKMGLTRAGAESGPLLGGLV